MVGRSRDHRDLRGRGVRRRASGCAGRRSGHRHRTWPPSRNPDRERAADRPSCLSVEEARDAVLAVAEPVGTEHVAAADALGRVVAETVSARVSLPPWPNSAMDGYAIVAADTAAADEEHPVELRVVGDIAAGAAPDVTVTSGTAARIATGARLPDGADAVVPVEATTPLDAERRPGPRGRDATGPVPAAALVHEPVERRGLRPPKPAATWRLERRSCSSRYGDDGSRRHPRRGRRRGSPSLVHRRPRIAVLATGDEVRAPGQELGPAGIPDANGPGLRALVTAAGGERDRSRHRHR